MNEESALNKKSSQHPDSKFALYQEELRECLHVLLANLHPLLREDSMRAFTMPGKLLAYKMKDQLLPEGLWALLPLLIALMLAPETKRVVVDRIAVAVECVICALDLLDDVEDEDQTQLVREIGVARTLNVSTALLTIAHNALLSLQSLGVAPQKIIQLLQAFDESILIATMGQHRDLLAEGRSAENFTDDECIEIAAQKAGALMRLACMAGAICADSDDTTCAQFARLGELLGIAHQLDNDSHDLYDLIQGLQYPQSGVDNKNFKTDLMRHKKTLPIVIAMREKQGGIGHVQPVGMDELPVQNLNEGIISAWGISLLYKQRAQELFHDLETDHTVSVPLRLLLGFAQ